MIQTNNKPTSPFNLSPHAKVFIPGQFTNLQKLSAPSAAKITVAPTAEKITDKTKTFITESNLLTESQEQGHIASSTDNISAKAILPKAEEKLIPVATYSDMLSRSILTTNNDSTQNQKFVENENDLLDINQELGHIISSRDIIPAKVILPKALVNVKPISYSNIASRPAKKETHITHQNGIFGSYCLEDVKCIANIVFIYQSGQAAPKKVHYDCFNYETVSEIKKSSEKINAIFTRNIAQLNEQGISYNLHYQDTNNDLIDTDKSKDWKMKQRYFEKNMLFFNPFCQNRALTEKLLKCFFNYAKNRLHPDGVVTIMWNPKRQDHLAGINVLSIAEEYGFPKVTELSGKKFADLTSFVHLKNSKTLKTAVANRSECSVSNKSTDIIFMFQRPNKTISNNIIADAFIAKLPKNRS